MHFFYMLMGGCFIAPVLTVRLVRAAGNLTFALFHLARIAALLVRLACNRWGIKRAALGGLLLSVGLTALSVGTAHAGQVSCVQYQPQYSETIQIPVAGQPGLVWVAARDADEKFAYFLTPTTGWTQYTGGLYPFYNRYDAGLPASLDIKSILPNTDGSTLTEQGWSIYVGYGTLTLDAQGLVQARREALNEMKPDRVAAGTWSTNYDSDDQFKWSLVQKNMTDNNQIQTSVATMPLLYCAPLPSGGN
jgi:hypothetical protein